MLGFLLGGIGALLGGFFGGSFERGDGLGLGFVAGDGFGEIRQAGDFGFGAFGSCAK